MRAFPIVVGVLVAAAGWLAAEEGGHPVRLYVGGYGSDIRWFGFSPEDGTLGPEGSVASDPNPSFVAIAPAGDRLYAVSEADGGRVVAFAIEGGGALRRLGDAASGGRGPCFVAVHPSGRWVFAANYGSGDVAVLPVTAAGLGAPTATDHAGQNAHMALPSPDGTRLLVPCLGSDHVAVYRFDAAAGSLVRDPAAPMPTAHGAGPRHLAFHPTLPLAYLIDELDDTLMTLAWDAAGGALSPRAVVPTLPPGADGARNSCAHVVVHPSGRFAYGSNRGHDSIAVFALDAAGVATPAGHANGDGAIRTPRHFALDPSGGWLLVANQDGGDIAVFSVDAGTGALTLARRVACAGAPTCLAFTRR